MPIGQNQMMSPAGVDLGLGDMLQQQLGDETEEQRKKRLAQQQSSAISPAVASLFGLSGGKGMGPGGAGGRLG